MASKKAIFRQTLILLPVFVNVIMMGAAVGWTPNALYLLKQFSNDIPTTFAQGSWIAASPQIGKLVFAIPAGILADKMGRKKICTSVAVINFACWLTLTISQSINIIFLTRFFMGITIALLHSIALAQIGEIASPELRSFYISMYQVCSYTGNLFESVISVIFSSYRILAASTTLLSLSYFTICWWLEESPNYLINVSKDNEAQYTLKYIRPDSTDQQLLKEYTSMKNVIDEEKQLAQEFSYIKFLCSKMNRKCLTIAIILNFFVSFVGSAPLSSYITLILPKNKYVAKKFYPLIGVILKLLSTLLASFFLNKLARKTLYITLACFVCGIHILNGFFGLFQANGGQQWSIPFIFGNYVFLLIWASLLEPVNDLVKSELFPQNVKGFGTSLCVMSLSGSKALSYVLFQTVTINLGMHWNYWIFAFNSFITAVIVYIGLPESRGKSLADIQLTMRKKVVIENVGATVGDI